MFSNFYFLLIYYAQTFAIILKFISYCLLLAGGDNTYQLAEMIMMENGQTLRRDVTLLSRDMESTSGYNSLISTPGLWSNPSNSHRSHSQSYDSSTVR